VGDDTTKVWRVGVLAPAALRPIESFKERLRGLGWIEGKNVRFDYRRAEGNDSCYPSLAAELVALPRRPDPNLGNAGGARRQTSDCEDPDRHRRGRRPDRPSVRSPASPIRAAM